MATLYPVSTVAELFLYLVFLYPVSSLQGISPFFYLQLWSETNTL